VCDMGVVWAWSVLYSKGLSTKGLTRRFATPSICYPYRQWRLWYTVMNFDRSLTVASLKPEISKALDSLLDEFNSANDAKVLRTAFQHPSNTLNPVVVVKPLQHYHGHLKPQQKVAPCVNKQVDNTNTTWVGAPTSQSKTSYSPQDR
jgi:hypothetical protein